MKRDDDPRDPSPFEQASELTSEDGARLIESTLATAPPGAFDRSVLDLLTEQPSGDRVLRHLSLEVLEGLVLRTVARLDGTAPEAEGDAWSLLDIVRRAPLLQRIAAAGATAIWAAHILALVDRSRFTFPRLFEQRSLAYGSRPLFLVPDDGGDRPLAWHQVAGRVDLIARGLLAVSAPKTSSRIAILSENRLELALTDLACLANGIVDVMIPANATARDTAYILGHARVDAVVVSNRDQLAKVQHARAQAPGLSTIIALDPDAAAMPDVVSFDEVLSRAGDIDPQALIERRARAEVGDLATIMYTSGTTGTPKGICFSQRNIVYKRFARALALPAVGEGDRFLSYLPLYHTFGRFLEMTGCVFWGATYCFAADPAIESLIRQMVRLKPTAFISIPMKWIQLYDAIRQLVDVESASEERVGAAVKQLTGGKLRWGLSAAGHLDPDVFRFFQRNGVELMSGFGMTEATGGITMTPPGRYREDSLGCPLPGIEVALAIDGELKVRGPYVMMGYLDPPDGAPSFDQQGWFHTGDLMERDRDGFLRIVDRKKEIYKNIKGQTIAPQKIENLFREFDSVGRVFLVGDHREYNTALIFPNFGVDGVELSAMAPDELKAHFRSLVVSANSFLAPYERIVDFAIIERDFDPTRGELTPKGTYRRKNIERNFADTIRLLYRRTTLQVGGAHVVVPNWLFQALGITTQELELHPDRLELPSLGTNLVVRQIDEETVRVGSARYRSGHRPIDLGLLLATPRLWLGNEQLFGFAPLTSAQRDRRRGRDASIAWLRREFPYRPVESDRRAAAALASRELDLEGLHLASLLLGSYSAEFAIVGVRLLEAALAADDASLAEHALVLLRRASDSPVLEVQRQALRVLASAEHTSAFRSTLARFLDRAPNILDDATTALLGERDLDSDRLQAVLAEAERRCLDQGSSPHDNGAASLLGLLVAFGASHPSRYPLIRAFLTRMAIVSTDTVRRSCADAARRRLEHGFREWLGQPCGIAVDPETRREYRWQDVVVFSEDVDDDARTRLLEAIRDTTMIREGVFLFSRGAVVRLEDILPEGVWIRPLGTDHGKSVFRIAAKTRQQEHHDLAVNLNRDLGPEEVREEIDWLVVCSDTRERGPVVEEFGGYWEEHGLWTEEFIPGDTLDRAIRKLTRRSGDQERLLSLWPFAAWSAMSAYVDFWDRTGRRLVIADPTPGNVIVPVHDYHTDARLVSISSRRPFESLGVLLRGLRHHLVDSIEREHRTLAGLVGWDVIFSSFLEIVGETEGTRLLHELQGDPGIQRDAAMASDLQRYLDAVDSRGFLPMRLYFAAKRFRRWQQINQGATTWARARTLQEMYGTYRLDLLKVHYPEVRPRFFRDTVFRAAAPALAEALDDMIDALRRRDLKPEGVSSAVADLRSRLPLDGDDDYFLARLSYPHLRPEDEAAYVATETGGAPQSEMVVTAMDREGRPYHIRHALSPKEVARLHRLFVAAQLPVQFRPEHRFLVAVNDRGALIGGLFYELRPDELGAHMDKVVVAEPFQGQGVAGALIEELCNRLRTDGYRSVTTGFFRPQFFYRYGFTVERRHAGLVRDLTAPADED